MVLDKLLDDWKDVQKKLGIEDPMFASEMFYVTLPTFYYKLAYEFLKKKGLMQEFGEWGETEDGLRVLRGLYKDVRILFSYLEGDPAPEQTTEGKVIDIE